MGGKEICAELREIAAGEWLNTILVQGSRIDRDAVEGLLRVLDSGEVSEALSAYKPTLIPIENIDADQVEEVIRDVFRSRLTPSSREGSSRSRVVNPLGGPPPVGAALLDPLGQQLHCCPGLNRRMNSVAAGAQRASALRDGGPA